MNTVDSLFESLVEVHQHAVFTTALRVSGSRADAEDLAAETFLRAYKALHTYSEDRRAALQARPWLVTITLNLWRNQARAAARARDRARDRATPAGAPADTPEDTIERRDEGERLAALVAALPPVQRAAVVLRHVVGLPYADVAAALGCPEGTAKSHVNRGLRRLRAQLEEQR